MTRSRPGIAALLLAAGLVPLGGCDQITDQPILEVEALGEVAGLLFNDLNGNRQLDQGDAGVEGWTVRLEQPGGGVLASAVTDTEGVFAFGQVPVGQVVLRVNETLLGDTLELFGVAFEPVTVAMEETRVLQPGVTYPSVTVAEARAAATNKPLFTTGVALNTLSQQVTVLHVQDVAGSGRVIRVRDLLGQQAVVGDSVRVRGRTARDAGQPILTMGRVFRLGLSSATLEPVETTTGEAAVAGGGELDGALVQVREAAVLEVEDLDEEGVRLLVDDGSGELEILFRAFLNENPAGVEPGSVVVTRARGLLVPREEAGETVWQLLPRARTDYRIDPIGTSAPAGTPGPSIVGSPPGIVALPRRNGPREKGVAGDPGGAEVVESRSVPRTARSSAWSRVPNLQGRGP